MKTIDINEVYTLFEEIKGLIKKESNSIPTVVQPEIEMPDLSTINELTNRLKETIEEVRKPVKTERHHIISIASSKTVFGIVVISVSLLISLFAIGFQRREINALKDSDLKYRYVKMQGEATPDNLLKLETIFTYEKDSESIKVVRKQVETYERLVKEQAEKAERARLNAKEAERLEKEAKSLKSK